MTEIVASPAVAVRLPETLGAHATVQLGDGREVRIVQLNNAATTPPFVATLAAVTRFLETYGALHRGAGPRARLTCQQVEKAIERIRAFLHCADGHALLFTENTSGAVNLFARMLRLNQDDVVLTSEIEHTSNNLPWRYNTPARVIEIRAFDSGALDYDDLQHKVQLYGTRIKLVSVSGASNQTGYVPDLHRISSLARSCGALLFVDAAQLAPHRPIDMQADGIDALAFSAHKVYAPFGLGVLALPRRMLNIEPVDPGGGSIDMISDSAITWAPVEERHQTGTWNATGIVALGASCDTIMAAGWTSIVEHEKELIRYTAEALSTVPTLTMYVRPHLYAHERRIGTFPFNLPGIHHSLLAAILEYEHGIEVRSGTICNHRLVRRWFDISADDQATIEGKIRAGDRLASYGIVRVSLGIHNTKEDIDCLVEALSRIAVEGYRLRYRPLPSQETYEPILG